MREAVYISDGYHMRARSLGPQNALKTKKQWDIFPPKIFYSFCEPLGLWFHGATVGSLEPEVARTQDVWEEPV